MAETNDKAKKTPIKLQMVTDDSLGLCDPVTGVCTAPAPPGETEPGGSKAEKHRDKTMPTR